ncbi:hypothetical protein N480_19030 [Pseudoalteromonas luteoviolacea S2607]|nr:hypothetical protein N480_19030 [Pseudoalteromonas luteoviolacea S2607]
MRTVTYLIAILLYRVAWKLPESKTNFAKSAQY